MADDSNAHAARSYDTGTRPASEDDGTPPPDGGYGWVCLACCFTINCFTWGVVASYGVYLSYYLTTNTFPESKPLDYAFIGGLNFGVAMLSAPLITRLVRSVGIKAPMMAGSFLFGGGFIAASFASRIWHLYLSQGVLVGLGVGFVYVPSIAVLSQWFAKRRSLANGVSAAGSGIGGLIFSFAIGAIIDHLGVKWALRITGITALLADFIAAILIRHRNRIIQPKQRPFDLDLVCRFDVLLLLSWAFLSMLGYIPLLYSLPDFAISIGLSRQQATQVNALLNMGTAIGRPLIGVASDRFGRFGVATTLTLTCGLLCFIIWIPASSYAVTVVFGILSGAILGVFWMVGTRARVWDPADTLDCCAALRRGCWLEGVALLTLALLAVCGAPDYVYVVISLYSTSTLILCLAKSPKPLRYIFADLVTIAPIWALRYSVEYATLQPRAVSGVLGLSASGEE
ncbi:hypothetical protein H2200_010726 [Cladophialophora chaetospira]|uniref:Major facilitator superfamily (MFS) profile domain-containing protein n=1 Tax=Cladophialophora chaetospira TaxID=386627 RepID=A0AA39CDW9_9EURO|nr:hypothetical protein H2200_010726 [Cladophialophora chaetospira]